MTGDERGSVTAEFAVALPAVVLVIALAVAALSAAGQGVRLEQAAAQAARLAARGESDATVRRAVTGLVPGASVTIRGDGDFVCADASTVVRLPVPAPALRASSCALASEAPLAKVGG